MTHYVYRGYRADGSRCRGSVDAQDTKQARRLLAENGIFVESVDEGRFAGRFAASARSSFYRELGTLLGSGLTLESALSLLIDSGGDRAGTVSLILSKIREGEDLSAAVSELYTGAESFEIAAIMSAERAGALSSMLVRAADFIDAQELVRDRIRSALVYPCFIICLGLAVATVMLGFVVPNTMRTLASAGLKPPASSTIIVGAAKFIAWAAAFAALAVPAGKYAVERISVNNRDVRMAYDKMKLHLYGKAGRSLAEMRFASVLSVLLQSGMQAVDALPVAGRATGNAVIENAAHEQSEKIRNGAPLSDGIAGIPVIGTGLSGWVKVGEAGGCLPKMLDTAAGRAARIWEKILAVRISIIEPAMIAGVGIFVLVVALAVLLPVIGMTKGIAF